MLPNYKQLGNHKKYNETGAGSHSSCRWNTVYM